MKRSTQISTLFPLHDAIPIRMPTASTTSTFDGKSRTRNPLRYQIARINRKSTRLNSSYVWKSRMPPFFFNEEEYTDLYSLSLARRYSDPNADGFDDVDVRRQVEDAEPVALPDRPHKSEEHTSELQLRVEISYAAIFF